jgi:hypothetical protein
MRSLRSTKIPAIILTSVILTVLFTPVVHAGIYYNVAIKGLYEDNVVGLLSDKRGGPAGMYGTTGGSMARAMEYGGMGSLYTGGSSTTSTSDTAIDLYADLGASRTIAEDTSLFLTGSVEHISYSSFTQFDSTIGGLSVGLNKRFGEMVTARVAINGMLKRFGDSQRDSTAYGASFALKEKLSESFWLKEGYAYEKDKADFALFSYNGNAVNLWAGYVILPKTTALLGYNYLVRAYDEPSGFKVTANTVSVGLEYEFAEKWFVDGLYDHQASDSNLPGTKSTDNLLSLGVRYSY